MLATKAPQGAQAEVDKNLWQIAPYSVYKQELPRNLSPKVQTYFSLITHHLHKHHPASITTVVATHYHADGPDLASPTSVRLYVFGRFRKTYSAITQMSVALADLYREIPILPIVSPVLAKDWENQMSDGGTFYRDIRSHGVLCYSVLERDAAIGVRA